MEQLESKSPAAGPLRVLMLGANSGIAEATARLYAAEGAALLLAGRDAERLEEILDTLLRFARRDFSARCEVSDAVDTIDAIATGFNMMAEELSGKITARSDLMAARDALRDAEARLLHTSRLAAIGQLASGVAHCFHPPWRRMRTSRSSAVR